MRTERNIEEHGYIIENTRKYLFQLFSFLTMHNKLHAIYSRIPRMEQTLKNSRYFPSNDCIIRDIAGNNSPNVKFSKVKRRNIVPWKITRIVISKVHWHYTLITYRISPSTPSFEQRYSFNHEWKGSIIHLSRPEPVPFLLPHRSIFHIQPWFSWMPLQKMYTNKTTLKSMVRVMYIRFVAAKPFLPYSSPSSSLQLYFLLQ